MKIDDFLDQAIDEKGSPAPQPETPQAATEPPVTQTSDIAPPQGSTLKDLLMSAKQLQSEGKMDESLEVVHRIYKDLGPPNQSNALTQKKVADFLQRVLADAHTAWQKQVSSDQALKVKADTLVKQIKGALANKQPKTALAAFASLKGLKTEDPKTKITLQIKSLEAYQAIFLFKESQVQSKHAPIITDIQKKLMECKTKIHEDKQSEALSLYSQALHGYLSLDDKKGSTVLPVAQLLLETQEKLVVLISMAEIRGAQPQTVINQKPPSFTGQTTKGVNRGGK